MGSLGLVCRGKQEVAIGPLLCPLPLPSATPLDLRERVSGFIQYGDTHSYSCVMLTSHELSNFRLLLYRRRKLLRDVSAQQCSRDTYLHTQYLAHNRC